MFNIVLTFYYMQNKVVYFGFWIDNVHSMMNIKICAIFTFKRNFIWKIILLVITTYVKTLWFKLTKFSEMSSTLRQSFYHVLSSKRIICIIIWNCFYLRKAMQFTERSITNVSLKLYELIWTAWRSNCGFAPFPKPNNRTVSNFITVFT